MAHKKAMPRGLLEASRHLRQRATQPEDLLWARLRDRQLAGSRFRRQAVIGKFVVDFYCHESRLIVELDGSVHDTPEVADRDISARRISKSRVTRSSVFATTKLNGTSKWY